MKPRVASTFVTVALALLIIIVPGVLPRSRPIPPKNAADLTATPVTDLTGFAKRRRDEHLAELARQGYKIGPSTVMAVRIKQTKSGSVWDRAATAFAETYSDSDAYGSLTALDDGNPDTFEFYGYGLDKNYDGEAWGVVHGYFDDEGDYVWANNGGQNVECGDPSLDRLLGFVSPAVHAEPVGGCGSSYNWRAGLKNATFIGFTSGFSAALYLPCWSGGWAGGAGCFGSGFVKGFATNLAYDIFDWSWWCEVVP